MVYNNKLKISYVTMLFPASTETFACSDVKILEEKGNNISVYSLRFPAKASKQMIIERNIQNISISHNSVFETFWGLMLLFYHPSILFKMILVLFSYNSHSVKYIFNSLLILPRATSIFFHIKKNQPDIIHLFWGHYPCIVGYLLKNYCPNMRLSMFLGAYDLIYNYGLTPVVLKMSDVIWTHSKANIRKIIEYGVSNKKIHLSYRGIDLRKLPKSYIKQKYSFISAGKLEKSKNMHTVIKLYSIIMKNLLPSTLTIIGDGPEKYNLKKISNCYNLDDSITFTGHISHKSVFEYLSQSEIFIFLSVKPSERLPNVVKEAMSVGCICIVSKTVGIEELIQDNINGYIIDPTDFNRINELIVNIYTNKDEFQRISNNAIEQIKVKFDANNNMNNYFIKWNNLIQNNQTNV